MITSSRIDIAVIIFHVSNIDGNKLISKNLIERREFHNAWGIVTIIIIIISWSWLACDAIWSIINICETIWDSGVACPRIVGGTILASAHIPHSGFMPKIADPRLRAKFGLPLKSWRKKTSLAPQYILASKRRSILLFCRCIGKAQSWVDLSDRTDSSSTGWPDTRWRTTRRPTIRWCLKIAQSPPYYGAGWTRPRDKTGLSAPDSCCSGGWSFATEACNKNDQINKTK